MATVNGRGKVVSTETFRTSEQLLIHHIKSVLAQTKSLIVEESSLAGWIRRILSPYVNPLIVCGSQHNALIPTLPLYSANVGYNSPMSIFGRFFS